jgi:hypothetical protein
MAVLRGAWATAPYTRGPRRGPAAEAKGAALEAAASAFAATVEGDKTRVAASKKLCKSQFDESMTLIDNDMATVKNIDELVKKLNVCRKAQKEAAKDADEAATGSATGGSATGGGATGGAATGGPAPIAAPVAPVAPKPTIEGPVASIQPVPVVAQPPMDKADAAEAAEEAKLEKVSAEKDAAPTAFVEVSARALTASCAQIESELTRLTTLYPQAAFLQEVESPFLGWGAPPTPPAAKIELPKKTKEKKKKPVKEADEVVAANPAPAAEAKVEGDVSDMKRRATDAKSAAEAKFAECTAKADRVFSQNSDAAKIAKSTAESAAEQTEKDTVAAAQKAYQDKLVSLNKKESEARIPFDGAKDRNEKAQGAYKEAKAAAEAAVENQKSETEEATKTKEATFKSAKDAEAQTSKNANAAATDAKQAAAAAMTTSLESINTSCGAQQQQLDEEKKTLLKIEESMGKTKVIKADKDDILPATVVVTGPPAVEKAKKNKWNARKGMTVPKAPDGSNFLRACGAGNGDKDIRDNDAAMALCKGECAADEKCAAVVLSPKGAWMMKATAGITENEDNTVLELV